MSSITPVRRSARVIPRHTELVVPDDVASAQFDYHLTGPTRVDTFVDTEVLGDFNAIHGPGGALERTNVKRGGRAVHLALATSPLLSSAPTGVLALVANLSSSVPESYVMWSDPSGDAWIVSLRAEGLRHGTNDFLRRAGVRQYAAHTSWRRLPAQGPVLVSAHLVAQPAIENVSYAPNGGLGTHGVTFAGSLQDSQVQVSAQWTDFLSRARHPRGSASEGGDGGANILYFKHPQFALDHTQLAWVAATGKRGPTNDAGTAAFYSTCQDPAVIAGAVSKLCYSHHGLTGSGASYPTQPSGPTPWTGISVSGPSCTVPNALSVDSHADSATAPQPLDYASFDGGTALNALHSRDTICQTITASTDPFAPANYYVSTSPTDGRGACDCQKCKDLLRNGPYGAFLTTTQRTQDATHSDNIFHGHNQVALFLDYWFANSTTIKPGAAILAYQEHSEVPSIPVASNSSVYLLPQTVPNTTNRTANEVYNGWAAKRLSNPWGRFALGMAPTWGTAQGFDVPRMSPRDGVAQIKDWVSKGFTKGLAPLTSYSTMGVGALTYCYSELAWDPTRDVEDLLTEWFSVFGAATTTVRAMFERWWKWFELTPHELGVSFRAMQTAQAALTADSSHTQAQQDCLDHVRAYVQWLAVFYEYTNAGAAYALAVNSGTLAALLTATDAAINWAWSVYTFAIIQSDLHAGGNLYTNIPPTGTGTDALRAKWDRTNGSASGWALVSTPTTTSLTTAMASGAAAYTPISGITRRDFGITMWPIFSATTAAFSGALTPFAPNSDPTLIQTAFCGNYQTYRLRKAAASLTLHFLQAYIVSPGATPLGCRIRLLDDAGNLVQLFTQDDNGVPFVATNTAGYDDRPFTITAPAGDYTLELNDDATCLQSCYLQVPRSTPFVQVNMAVNHIGNEPPYLIPARKVYFYVPVSETAVALAFAAIDSADLQFYDNTGTARSMTRTGLNSFSCAVPSGQDGKVWSFDHIQSRDANSYPNLENCPSLFSYDPQQMMIPHGLDGF